ncbi:MAG TPA: PAS domain S-box protein, partial [Gemmatimonadaceae bacterium]
MSNREESRTRRNAAVGVGALAVLALAVLVKLHVTDLRDQALTSVQRTLTMSAVRAARMVDMWVAERETDAGNLTEIAGIHGTDSTAMSPEIAGRILHFQMNALARRGYYTAIWIVGESGRIHGSVGGAAMTATEDSAVHEAIATGKMAVSRPEKHDSIVTVGVATPVIVTERGVTHPGAAVLFRADMNRALTIGGTVRGSNGIAAVLVMPKGSSTAGIRVCGDTTSSLCVASTDSISRRALHTDSWFGNYIGRDGRPMLVASRRLTAMPWAVYIGESEEMAFATMRARLRFEAYALLCILLIGGLAIYAFDRSANLYRLRERAQSDERFAAIVNTARDAIIIVDARYQITVMNSAAQSMFGYGAQDALGTAVLDLMPEASREELRAALDQTIRATDTPRRYAAERHASAKRRDGSTFPIDLTVSRTQIDGRSSLTIVIRDITERKRTEESSEWQRRVLESIASGVELRDVLRTIARFHETQCPGVECGIHLIDDDGVTLRSASAPSMRPEFVEAMDEIVIGPRASTCGTAVYRREQVIVTDIASDPLWNDYRALAVEQGYRASWATPIRSPQGRILGSLAMYVNEPRQPSASELRVTATATHLAGIAVDRAHAAESLRQSEASFRSFVENSPIGIYRATGTGRLLAVNESLVKLLDYDSALELLQVDMATHLFVNAPDRERLFRQLEAHGELRSADMEWRKRDGSTVLVRISARAYRDERGSVWFSEGFVENVTPLRAAEQALRQSEKLVALGQLVSGVAHELNNPLAAILHFAEDLLDDERTAADLEALSVIRDQARRSRSIVRDLL